MLPHNPARRKALFLLIIIVASYLFFFYHLGSYSLKEPDEGRYAEIPREMVETGDYVVPHLNYVRYFEKPPLFYWMTALSYRVFGINEWSFRIPNAVAALLGVVVTYLFAARWFGGKTALISALILMSSFGYFAMAHIVTIDMLFAVLLFISLLCFYEFYRSGKPLFLYLFFTALALAILAKGPVAAILLGTNILLFLFTEKRLSFLKEMVSVKGLLLFSTIAAPWFILISIQEKEFFQFFFIDQHLLRFLTTKHKRSGPLYYFLPVLVGGLFPWSVFLPRAVIQLWRVKELKLFFIWSAVVFVFFSVSGSKLPAYILPVFPAVSLILGSLFETGWRQRVQKNREIVIYGLFFACLALAGALCAGGLFGGYLKAIPDIVSISRDIRGLLIFISLVSVIIVVFLLFKQMRTYSALFFMLCAFSFCVVIGLMFHARVIDGFNTAKGPAQVINLAKKETSLVVNYGSFDETVPFYIRGRTYLASHTGELEMGSKYPEAQGFFLSEDDLVRLFQSDKDVFVVFKEKKLSHLRELFPKSADNPYCGGKRCVITNRRTVSGDL
jgi:4-amino-4-deoxy-L-arabinose transferase-like glycosyltransferase